MTGGQSAREQAEETKVKAAALQRRADRLSQKSGNYEQGARGEEDVSWELDQLATDGWLVLHDRRLPTGANLDHLLVGPPGVIVIETKTWTGDLDVEAGHIAVNGRRKLKEMRQVKGQVAAVGEALSGQPEVAVRGYLVLAGPHHRDQPAVDLDGTVVAGLYRVTAHLGVAEVTATQSQIEAAFRTLSVAFPGASDPNPPTTATMPAPSETTKEVPEPTPPSRSPIAHQYFYLRTWQRYGKHRIYLRTVDGSQLGWKDMKSGAVTVETDDKDLAKLSAAVLASALPTSIPMVAGELPKVYPDMLGGRLIGRLTRLHMAVVIGHEWKKGSAHRLYGTFVAPETDAIDLGYVDLHTGARVPAIDGPVRKDRPTADAYLKALLEHRPEPGPAS